MDNHYDSGMTRSLDFEDEEVHFFERACTFNDDEAKHRGLAFEEILFDTNDGLRNDDEANHRGLAAFEENLFAGNDGLRDYDVMKGNHTPVPQPLPTKAKLVPTIPTVTVTTTAAATVITPRPLTTAAGFVSCHHLFCGAEADVERMVEACVVACESHDCEKKDGEGGSQWMRFTHFSRAHFNLAFEVRVWSVPEGSSGSCCGVLRGEECPAGAAYVVEFHKMEGCSSQWTDLFSKIGCVLLDGAGSPFFGRRPQPAPKLLDFAPEDERDDACGAESECAQDDVNLFVRMLSEGSPESQQAAVSSMVHHAVTKQACDQLVESGFLEAAFRIVAGPMPMPHTTADLALSQLTLLRCILLVVSSVVTHSGTSAVAGGGVGAFVTSLHASNPSVFTRDHAPLLKTLQAL
jgi:hypothetical protein